MFDWSKGRKQKIAETASGRSLDDLFRLQRGPLLRFVQSRVKNEAEAEEIVQEVFIRFQKNYDSETTASPEALLAKIAGNLVIDRVRERDARASREDAWGKLHTAGADEDFSPTASASVDPSRALEAKQQIAKAMAVLDSLPEKTRTVFMLHRFEGLSHAEIVERTGIPRSTVEKQMIRAIKALATIRSDE